MKVLVLDQSTIMELLPMDTCMGLMEQTLVAASAEEVVQPLRQILWLPDQRAALGVMPGYLARPEALGVKVISVFPGNHGTSRDSHQGAVLLFDSEHGQLLALLDASSITAIRTAAVSGVATRALARSEAGDLALLGTGVQARTHLWAMAQARSLRRVRVYSRTPAHVESFVAEAGGDVSVPIEACESAEQAVRGADLICTVTSSKEPVLLGDWLGEGAHVNAVGACTPRTRELDGNAMARCRLFTDRRESLLKEAGDFLLALDEGKIDDSHLCGELGDVLRGDLPGRSHAGEITLFKSLGIAVEDLACARYLYDAAGHEELGTLVELGGERFGSS